MQVQTATLIPLAWVTDFMQKTLQSAIIVMWIWYIKQTHQKSSKKTRVNYTSTSSNKSSWYRGYGRMVFENCHIISRLNLFSRDDRPKRSLLKDCHLECTDDSLGTGYITIFENCTFDLYSNTPCGGASFYMQAYLGCDFTTHLHPRQ